MTKEEFAKEEGIDPDEIGFYEEIDTGYTINIIKEPDGTEPQMHICPNFYEGEKETILSLIRDEVLKDDTENMWCDKDNIDFLNENWEALAEDWNKENNNNFDFSKIERPIYKVRD